MNEDDYVTSLRTGWDRALLPVWMGLRLLLETRPGWHFDVDDHGEPSWDFGLGDASRIVVVADDWCCVRVYIAERDKTYRLFLESLVGWLEEHEAEFEGFTPLQKAFIAEQLDQDLERISDYPRPR